MIERFQGREMTPDEKDVVEKVEKFGWMVMNIKDEPGKPGWSYTIGLFESYQHPEIVMFGLKDKSRHSILNWIGQNVRDGKPFTAGREHDWVLENFNCWSKPVDKRWYRDLFGYASWFYRTETEVNNFPCVQAIWPDKDGHYPWEPEYGYSDQPLLYESELVSARMMHYASDAELSKAEWPFDCEPHTGTYVSRCVMEDGEPIVRAVHDWDGDWQFIGPVEDPSKDGGKLSCFHCVVERDPTIKLLAGMPPGVRALRESPSAKWTWEEIEKETE